MHAPQKPAPRPNWHLGRSLLFGVVHLPATPGSPGHAPGEDWLSSALADARALAEGGADAIVVENFGDAPFFAGRVPAETTAALAVAVHEVRRVAPELPVGVNCLRNDALSALGIAASTGASFVRINVHVGSMVTDQGLIEGDAATTLRERMRLCPGVELLCDVHVKHAAPLAPRPIEESAAETLGRGRADALILSGTGTGSPTDASEMRRVRERLPEARLLVGSGLTPENAPELLSCCQGAIVGTWLKEEGRLERPVDPERVRRMRALFDGQA